MNANKYLAYSLINGFKEEISVLSHDLKILDANKVFLKNHSVGLTDIIGKPCHDVLYHCNKICLEFTCECPVFESMSTGKTATIINSDVVVDGNIKHFKIHVYPLTGENGEKLFLHISRDITQSVEERRLQENMWKEILLHVESLHQTMVDRNEKISYLTDRVKNLMEIIPLAVVEWDINGNITYFNHSAEILLSLGKDKVLGSPFIDLFPVGAPKERFKKIFEKILQGQMLDYCITENRTGTGKILPFEWYHSALSLGGEIKGGISIGQDLSELRTLQHAQESAQDKLQAIQTLVPNPIIIANRLLRVIFWNTACETEIGWLDKEMIGKGLELLFPASKRDYVVEKLREILDSSNHVAPKNIEIETNILRRDKTTFPCLIICRSTVINKKKSIILMIKNLTEQRKIQELLSHSEKMRALGEMTEGLIHDLNNTMTSISGGVQLLQKLDFPKSHKSILKNLEKSVNNGIKKIKALIEFSSTEKQEDQKLQLYPLRTLVQEVLETTRFKWKDIPEKKGINFKIKLNIQDIPPILIYPSKFKEALTNILFNSIEALESEGGEIKINGFQQGQEVVLQIQDDGIGMDKDTAKRSFEPYFTTKGHTHAGLGLNTAKKIIEQMGGKLRIDSLKGVGTICHITLPQITTTLPSEVSKEKTISANILLIEDDELISELLSNAFNLAGFMVAVCHNGKQGIKEFKKGSYHIVITDLGMPNMNGINVAEKIKKISPSTPVFLITGWITDKDLLKFKPVFVDEILFKPFDLDRLIDLIKKYIKMRKNK